MRIISGTHGGTIIRAPGNLPVRPTTDRAKEGLFNILNNQYNFDRLTVLDLFAGTGNISFEMASRGCTNIVAVDQSWLCCDFIKKETSLLQFHNYIRVLKADAISCLSKLPEQFDLIFADPPYKFNAYELLVNKIFDLNLLAENGCFILEHSSKTIIKAGVELVDQRKYGQSTFSIYKKQ